jgi:hypothetical protein
MTRFTLSSDWARTSRLTEPSASLIACGGFLVVTNGFGRGHRDGFAHKRRCYLVSSGFPG